VRRAVTYLVALVFASLLVLDGRGWLPAAGVILTAAVVVWSPFVLVALPVLAVLAAWVDWSRRVVLGGVLHTPFGGYTPAEMLVTSRPELQGEPSPSALVNLDTTGRFVAFAGERLGTRMRPTSVYRSEELNTAVGGATTSDHMNGLAWDVVSWTGDPVLDVEALALVFKSAGIEWDQLIAYPDRGHVHIGFGSRLRNVVFTTLD
jgi:zinc D-Ala-D-Ala carboxypeptidase